jgi:starch synthase (maltosyl-transferring)
MLRDGGINARGAELDIEHQAVTTDAPARHVPPPQARAPRMPRVYYLSPLLAGPLSWWRAHFERIARLGFDHVLIAPPFATGPSGDIFLPADYQRVNHSLEWPGDADAALSAIASDCAAFGLTPLLDVVLDQVAAGSPLAAANPDLFATPDERAALDPRGPGGNFEAARLRPGAPGVSEAWAERLGGWLHMGIGGFRIVSPGAVPPTTLRALIASVRRHTADALLLGWTPGANLQALAGADFDFVFSSLPWWDFRAEWFWTELEALSRIGPIIAAPEAPFGPRLATTCHDPASLRPIYDRNLSFAALLGAGWMMPMGFEFASPRRMDPACDAAEDFSRVEHAASFDLSERIAALNRVRDIEPTLASARPPVMLAGAGSACLALLRGVTRHAHQADRASLLLANADPSRRHSCAASTLVEAAGGAFARFEAVLPRTDAMLSPGDTAMLEPGEVALYRAVPTPPAATDRPPLRETAEAACAAPRIAIEAIAPSVEGGPFPAKRIAGETVTVEADVIADGHDVLGVALLWRPAGDKEWREVRMQPLGNDRWQARFPVARIGAYEFTVEAWRDAFGSFRDELGKKHSAGVNTALEVQEGVALVAETAGGAVREFAQRLERSAEEERRILLLSPEVAELMAAADPRPFRVRAEPTLRIEAERTAARFASWYEIFPRSMSDDPHRHGNFADVIRHLPRIRDMGFDVLYFPPIHPIGRTNRKGRNNSLQPATDDPGSPYAIGGAEGGHDAIHPELGTLQEFHRLRDAAEQEGMELALDFAIQCSPDHPWLRDHKDWFDWRPDGSLRYAENPPKKYEDIVNVDFYAPGAVPDLWIALCDVVLFWAGEGVRLFRVDNPHTKPLPFWEWMIGEVRARYPDAIFLAEAFTRPKVMYRLAKVGFSQSYTYFTWRNTKLELIEYFEELTTTAPKEFFRPHLFVNTPDINPIFLQGSGRAGFLIRAALATTLSGLWGMYNGFELCEARPLPGREEYADSEKYQIRAWDWDRPGNIVAEITRLNRIRQTNPALQTHLNVTFHNAFNDAILYYEKATPDRSNVLLVAVSLDPHNAQEADFEAPLWNWGLSDDAALEAEDLVRGTRTVWTGKRQHVRLDPAMPYAIWRARPAG